MGLSNIKKMRDEQGFTIVELLIVIIVIGILAAIIIVAYNGVTSSARDSSAHAAAVNVQKKLEAYNANAGSYPPAGATTAMSTYPASTLANSGLSIGTPTSANGQSTVQVNLCSAPAGGTGYQITYWNYITNSLPGTPQITGGQGSTTCTAWATVAT